MDLVQSESAASVLDDPDINRELGLGVAHLE